MTRSSPDSASPSMDIYAKPGTRVRFTGQGGYDHHKDHALTFLVVGSTYTVAETTVSAWHTDVYLEEFPKEGFNSVMFVEVATQPATPTATGGGWPNRICPICGGQDRHAQNCAATGGDAVAATPTDHEDSEELRTLADMIGSMSGRMSLEDDRTTLIMAATQLRRFAAGADAAERTIHLLEANARIQAKLLADTGRERDSLLNVAQGALAACAPDSAQIKSGGVDLTPEGYVAAFIRHGEKSRSKLPAWEQPYQDAGLIEQAKNLGYIWIAGNVGCDVAVTAHGRTAAELHDLKASIHGAAQSAWQPMSVLPDVGRKFICLYDDGSGAVMFWRHNDGYIDQDGDDCNLERGKYDRWAYLPDELEFYCETRAEDPMCLTLPSPDRDSK